MSLLSFLSSPITLAAAAVIAIGVIVYEIVNHQKEERVPSHGGGRRPGSNSGNDFRGSDSTNTTSYKSTESNIRRRKREETETKSVSLMEVSKHEDNGKSTKASSPNPEFDKINYSKNVHYKMENDVRNINKDEDGKKTFHKNIHDSVSESSANSASVDSNETKLINIPSSDANKEDVQQTTQGAISKSGIEENIVHSQEKSPSYNEPCCSTTDIAASGMQNDNISDNPMCKACEEVHANAVVYPCKHCSLCIECATIVYRIYNKCCICESDIDYVEAVEKKLK